MSDENMSDVHAALNWAGRVDRVVVLNEDGVVPSNLDRNLDNPVLLSVPEGRRVEDTTDIFDAWRSAPVRAAGLYAASTVQSFIDITARLSIPDTAIYLNRDQEVLSAVINGHGDALSPGFGDLRVSYGFPRSDEMVAWEKLCSAGDGVGQSALGVFLDDHLPEIINPDKASLPESIVEFLEDTGGKLATRSQMLNLSRDIQVDVESMTAQRVNLDNGEHGLQFSETHNTTSKGKRITIPQMFLIAIPVYDDGDRFMIPVRLQYRIVGGAVKFFLTMWRKKRFVREAMDLEVDKVRESLSDLPIFEGIAPNCSEVRP